MYNQTQVMKTTTKIVGVVLLASALFLTACNRNYYSGTGKKSKNCGCPSVR